MASNPTLPEIDPRDRLRVCHLAARLALVDGRVSPGEARLIKALMETLGLTERQRAVAWEKARDAREPLADIEVLRRNGEAARLVSLLGEVAAADGVIDPREAAMIARVREVMRLRLGAGRFPMELESLATEPLEERYELYDVLGEGGFAVVYAARRVATGQRVVIKRLKAELKAELKPRERAQIEDRFWREVKVLGSLQSPYTVRLIDAGFDVETPYMVLEHIEGRTLGAVLRQDGPLKASQVKRVMAQILESIAEAHRKGVVHRDLKPDNIMITGYGRRLTARVLDFGLAGMIDRMQRGRQAVITVEDQTVGTPFYMPPEQIREIAIKRVQTDLYALGLILSEALTGRRAVPAKNHFEAIHWQMTDAPLPINEQLVGTDFAEVIAKATAKDWRARHDSAEALTEALNAVDVAAAEETLRAIPPLSPSYGRWALAAAVLLVAVWAWGQALIQVGM